tara:strand:+ start:295 stop:498 length:204 start_codon:yes stop_codon:yes gene_type:complete
MSTDNEQKRAQRMERARAFLAAGRTQIDLKPLPAAKPEGAKAEGDSAAPADPTRFGDWEKNGRCIDF